LLSLRRFSAAARASVDNSQLRFFSKGRAQRLRIGKSFNVDSGRRAMLG
jgi:hypothetical protein